MRELFAVVSNSAAGHTAIASLPLAAILLMALKDRTGEDDRAAMRAGLMLAAFYVTIVIAVGVRMVLA